MALAGLSSKLSGEYSLDVGYESTVEPTTGKRQRKIWLKNTAPVLAVLIGIVALMLMLGVTLPAALADPGPNSPSLERPDDRGDEMGQGQGDGTNRGGPDGQGTGRGNGDPATSTSSTIGGASSSTSTPTNTSTSQENGSSTTISTPISGTSTSIPNTSTPSPSTTGPITTTPLPTTTPTTIPGCSC